MNKVVGLADAGLLGFRRELSTMSIAADGRIVLSATAGPPSDHDGGPWVYALAVSERLTAQRLVGGVAPALVGDRHVVYFRFEPDGSRLLSSAELTADGVVNARKIWPSRFVMSTPIVPIGGAMMAVADPATDRPVRIDVETGVHRYLAGPDLACQPTGYRSNTDEVLCREYSSGAWLLVSDVRGAVPVPELSGMLWCGPYLKDHDAVLCVRMRLADRIERSDLVEFSFRSRSIRVLVSDADVIGPSLAIR